MHIQSLSRKIALFLILVMLYLSCAALAEDSTPQYAATKDFVAVLEANDLKYSYGGIDDDKNEFILISYLDDDFESIVFYIFVSDDSAQVSIRGWDLLTASAGKSYALNTVNELNNKYKFTKFTFDESDNTVSVELDGYLSEDHPGEVIYKMLRALSNILDIDDCREALKSLI